MKMEAQMARRKDGTPAQKGDFVVLVTDRGDRHFGKIAQVDPPMSFRHLRFQRLQTYRVRCRDGMTRPCHARHIKTAFISKFRRAA